MAKSYERPRIATRLRGFDLDFERFPHRRPDQWLELTRRGRDGNGVIVVFDDHNMIMDAAYETIAMINHGDPDAWRNGRWYMQGLGTGAAAPARSQRDMVNELFRKGFIDPARNGREVYRASLFTATDFASASTTVAAAPAPTTTSFTLTSATGFMVGDLLRVGLPTGYEYRTIGALAGAAVTLAALDPAEASLPFNERTTGPLSAAPGAGVTIDQVIDEAALFGDLPASYTTGTVSVTNGSAIVTGAGGASWNTGIVAPGDKIRIQPATTLGNGYVVLPANRVWATIQSIDSPTQITLTAPWAGATASGAPYVFRATIYNRVNRLRYVKLNTRGFLFEDAWKWGG